MDIDPSTKFVAAEDQVSTRLESEVVILSLRSGGYYSFKNVAARIWALIEEPRSLAEIRDIVAQEYEEDPQVVQSHAMEFLEQLTEIGLAHVVT